MDVRQQLVHGLLGLTGPVVERCADVRDRLREQVLPGGHDRLALGQHTLLIIRQHVRAEATLRRQVMAIGCQLGGVDQRLSNCVIHGNPLEIEEAQRIARAHHALIDDRLKIACLVIVDVNAATQTDIRPHPMQCIADLGQLGQGSSKRRRVKRCNGTAIAGVEGLRCSNRLVQQLLSSGNVGADQREVPADTRCVWSGWRESGHERSVIDRARRVDAEPAEVPSNSSPPRARRQSSRSRPLMAS